MRKMPEIINWLKEQWGAPREAIHRGQRCPFLLVCSFGARPTGAAALEEFPIGIPDDVREFWRTTQSAVLFKDEKYGQCGTQLLEPKQALIETEKQITARPRDFANTDLVLGRFLGDSDLVVVACDPGSRNYGSIIIALPLDRRCDWPVAARSFAKFLEKLVEAQGDKYWEVRQR